MNIALKKLPVVDDDAPAVKFDIEALLMDQAEAAAEIICKDNGLRFRVVQRQGCPCIVTRDHVMTRMNVSITDGFVTHIHGRG